MEARKVLHYLYLTRKETVALTKFESYLTDLYQFQDYQMTEYRSYNWMVANRFSVLSVMLCDHSLL